MTFNDKFRLTTLDVKLRIAPSERYMLSPTGLVTITQGKPIIWLAYQKGLKGVLDCPFNYDKIQAQISYSWLIRYLGKSKVTVQAGYVFGDVPLFENFNIFGNNNGFGIYATESFATMQINEFICDRFVVMFFSHNFGKFFKTKYFSPDFIFETNVGWGDISDVHQYQGVELKSMSDGYYESGLVIDKIFKLGISNFGFGAYYRYGPNAFDKIADNFAYKIKLSVAF